MINTDRIVPATKTDLLTLYGNIMTIAEMNIAALEATNPGEFEVSENPTSDFLLANEPVTTIELDTAVTAVDIYFVAAHDFAGFTQGGETITLGGGLTLDDVDTDGATLYQLNLSSGTFHLTKVGF